MRVIQTNTAKHLRVIQFSVFVMFRKIALTHDSVSFRRSNVSDVIINISSIFSELSSTERQEGFDFGGYQTQDVTTLNKFTDNNYQLLKNQKLPATAGITTINNIQQGKVNDEILSYSTIRELLEDSQQMFRLDCDPTFFDSMSIEDNLNNNIGLEQIKDLDIAFSDSWIPAPNDIYSELPDSLFEGDMMEKSDSPPPSPIPAPPSPIVEAVQVKSEDSEFDLIKYIIFGEVSSPGRLKFTPTLNILSYPSQDADLLTPVEEKPCPTFEQPLLPPPQITIKPEPEPSTSAAPSPKHFEAVESVKSLRRRAPKRRYSSDSEYSISTSASSFNATSKRTSKKKRGRPAKELITDLPTLDDFSHMPIEHASHLVLRIKNNEASRKSRMKSKSKQTAVEDDCDRLTSKQKRLRAKRNHLEAQIETLRRWLLGLN